jgi:23S rRNA maturation-related 3'-5' exoribonuclease YhaM
LRHDIFQDRKSIHIKLSKESHAALREKLFKCGLSMQDVFEELADLVLSDNSRADRLIQSIIKKKIQEQLDGPKKNTRHRHPVDKFDAETLYNLIDEGQEFDDDRQAR